MTRIQLRWLLLAIAGGLVSFVLIRRRKQIAEALPQPLVEQAERFVIPWPSFDRSSAAEEPVEAAADEEDADLQGDAEDQASGDSMRRKVSSTHRISFRGKRYGPLPESLIGQQVEVETSDGKLFVLHQGQPIATFDIQE